MFALGFGRFCYGVSFMGSFQSGVKFVVTAQVRGFSLFQGSDEDFVVHVGFQFLGARLGMEGVCGILSLK